MRIALAGILIAALSVGGVGCTNKTSPKGGPGKTVVQQTTEHRTTESGGQTRIVDRTTTVIGSDKDTTFDIKDPGTTRLNQGESKTVTISIDRGRKFAQAVKLSL